MNEWKQLAAKRLLACLLAAVLCMGILPADAAPAAQTGAGPQAGAEDAQADEDDYDYEVEFRYSVLSDFDDILEEKELYTDWQYLKAGEKPMEPEAFGNGSRTIIGWTLERDSRTLYDFDSEVTGDLVLYPVTDKCCLAFYMGPDESVYRYVDEGETLADIPELPKGSEAYENTGWGCWLLNDMGSYDHVPLDFATLKITRDYLVDPILKANFDYQVTFHYMSEGMFSEGVSLTDFPEVYDPENGIYKSSDRQYLKAGEKPTEPKLDNGHRKVVGWTTTEGSADLYDFGQEVTGNLDLYPVTDKYCLRFYWGDEDDEFQSEEIVYVNAGEKLAASKVPQPKRENFTFDGWYGVDYDSDDLDWTMKFDVANTLFRGDRALRAKWKAGATAPDSGAEEKVTSVTLSAPSLVIPKGKSQTLSAATAPLKNAAITWKSSDESVATVSNGTVTAKKAGDAMITVTAVGGVSASCKVTVAEVKLNAASATLKTKQSSTALKIESKYPKNDAVSSYKSSNPNVVKVSGKGKLTACKKTGTAVITVTMKSGATAACKITVQKGKVTTKKLVMNVKKLTLKKKKSATLSVTRNPVTAAEKITWSSSDKKVATVTGKGKVTAKKKGKAIITAKTSNGKKATCRITVK